MICIADDILIYGQNQEDHNSNLIGLLKRCSERKIKLNKEKSVFNTDQLSFIGHTFTSEGLKPDERKVEAIIKTKEPENVDAVLRLQGMVNYLARFLPKLSDVMEPIRRLTHQDVEWRWSEEQGKAFREIKHLVTSAPILRYYDQEKELTIQCDASSKGLGAVLLQEGRPIAYAGRSLTSSEQRYAQIEKESLAMLFASKKFHQYTFGRSTLVETDHKPLEMIVTKPLYKTPKSLQSILLRLAQYDIKVTYKPGKELFIADTISRAYLDEHYPDKHSQVNAVGHLKIGETSFKS